MRRLFSNRQRERAQQEALFVRLSAVFERRMATELRSAYRDAGARIEAEGELGISAALAPHRERFERLFINAYTNTADTFAKRIRGSMKAAYPRYRKDFGFTFEDRLDGFVRTWTATKVVQINSTTEQQIKGIVRRVLERGDTLADAAKEIRAFAGPMSATRAHIIARTETHTAANAGLQMEAEVSEFDMAKEWISSLDDRVRTDPPDEFDHAEPDGQTASKLEGFDVGGEILQFPGDPLGSAGNIINCRCATGWAIL